MEDTPDLLLNNTKKFLRSALISSKGGLPAEQVYRDYRDLVGEGIPYRRLGYETLDSFLSAQPDVCRISRRPTGEVVVVGVADEATRHIQELVSRQNSKTKKSKAKPKRPARRPLQQSTQWNAPPMSPQQQQQQQQPARAGGSGRFPAQRGSGRGGGGPGQGQGAGGPGGAGAGFRGGGRPNPAPRGGNSGGRGGGGRFNNGQNGGSVPLREPRGGGGPGQQQGGGRAGQATVKSPPRGQGGGGRGQQANAKTNFKGDLQTYFTSSNLGDVPFKIASMGTKGKEKYMATVTVEGEQFKTYPQTYNSQGEAEEALAEIIVRKLGILSGGDGGGGMGETSDATVYADRVVELIGDRQNGVWSNGIEQQYVEKYGEKLPSLWFQEVEAVGRIRVDCPIPGSGRYIVFPLVSHTQPVAPGPQRTEGTPEASFSQMQPPALGFPDDDLWDVFINCARSTTNLSIRLVGDDTSERFEDLSSNMDLHYYDKDSIPRVDQPEIGRIYAAHLSSDWHRVRVVEVRGLDCTCWFIDHGDTEVVPAEDLREMAPKFLDLPPQAVTMQLAGLEDYEYSEAVLDHLNSLLLGKSLVAKVENRQLLGSHYLKSGKSVPRLVLFDTSSEDVDVNLNQKLLELLVSQDSQSKLPLAGGEEISVLISHIDKNGDIYVQKESSAFTMVEKLIMELGDAAMSSAPAAALLPDRLYLVKYNEDGGLYRAALLPDQVDGDTVQVFFVDYGNSSAVSKADIWELSSLPEPLVQELARQALRCRLAGAPPPGHSWSEQATTALRELVPEGQTVRLRVTSVAADSVSLVEVHLPDSKDGSVNFDLSTELELFALSPSSQPPSPAKTSGPTSPAGPPVLVAPAAPPVLVAPAAPPVLVAAPPVLVTNGTTGPAAVEAERPVAQYRPPALGSAFLLIPPTASMSEGERAGEEKAWTGTVTTVNAEKKLGFLTPDKSLPTEYKGNSLFFHCNVVKNSLGRPVRLEHGSKVKFVLYKAKDGGTDNLERPKAFAVYVTDPMAAELEGLLPALGSDLASMKTLLAPTIPAAGRYFDVNVTFAVSPSSFVVQPYNEGHQLEQLMTELNAFYTAASCQAEGPREVAVGEFFASVHTDGFWYRVKVANVIDSETAAVRFVDYGDLTMVAVSDLRPLLGQFRNLPYQAISARLAGVAPAEGDWKPEDTVWFNNRVSEKQFVSVVKAVEGTLAEPVAVLCLVDTSHPSEDTFIATELIQDGRGVAPPQ